MPPYCEEHQMYWIDGHCPVCKERADRMNYTPEESE